MIKNQIKNGEFFMPYVYCSNNQESILQNNISLFLGTGSSMQYEAPSWNGLINEICPKFKHSSNIDRAQYAELQGIEVKREISKKFSLTEFDLKRKNTYLNYLLNFDYKSIWTTNYDGIIEKVLKRNFKNFELVYRYRDFEKLAYPGSCFLFKINGSYTDPSTIVLTKEDFIDYRRTHEAYLILLKRELLCHNFLFLGCSFDDDILRICVKDILNCIKNSSENYVANHFAVIVEKNRKKLNFISKGLVQHYNINCLKVSNVKESYKVSYGISYKVKYSSIFVSGAKNYIRHSEEENIGKLLCQNLVNAFMQITDFPFKFISGMGMSIGHFICGTIKQKCRDKNINRYLQMEPFPFTSPEDNQKHRKSMINKAGIFIFIFGDYEKDNDTIENNGMWKEYILAKCDKNNIIIPLPCGEDSVSTQIYKKEKIEKETFSSKYVELLDSFDYKTANAEFFNTLVEKVILITREKMDIIIDKIVHTLQDRH